MIPTVIVFVCPTVTAKTVGPTDAEPSAEFVPDASLFVMTRDYARSKIPDRAATETVNLTWLKTASTVLWIAVTVHRAEMISVMMERSVSSVLRIVVRAPMAIAVPTMISQAVKTRMW